MQLAARSEPMRDGCVRIIGSVMDLHSRRPGMFENSRSSGMWLAEAPSATPLFPSSFAGPASLSTTQWTLLGRLPTPSPCPAVLPRSPPVYPSHRCGHQLGAPNSRVTKDAPLAWLGRARLLGAQMMYVDYFCLSSSLALARAAVIAFAFRALDRKSVV